MNRLRQTRKLKGITLNEVAEDIGITKQALSYYETEKREPRKETWVKLADYYCVPVAYLMGLPDGLIRYADEYVKGQNDMLALIKDAYYRADKETFEQLLDAEDENEIRDFLRIKYINQGIKIGRKMLLREIAENYDINF
ncbi:MAG: helix-turn-helix transcriptional regulator [Ligilactobacillus salivarius]|nr:helix-turn-helix transcriptional regulator [Ligilactobacillus salivarius]MDY5247745.1 helix-turn-helix transcriptional regulator [Ligilactobacillus salivarius]